MNDAEVDLNPDALLKMDKKDFALFPFFASLIAFLLTGIYLIQRYPLEMDHTIVLKLLSVSLALINIPYCLYFLFNSNKINFYQFNLILIVSILGLLVFAGILNIKMIMYPLSFLGIVAFCMTLLHCFEKYNRIKIFHVLLIIFLSMWIAGLIWSGRSLTPLFLEKIICGMYNSTGGMDTLFHMSMAQMIKTYNFPSTGLDELPYIPYHYGSHFLFAQISKVLEISILDMYNFGFPVIFFSLFFYVVFVVYHQFKDINTSTDSFDYFFWMLLLAVFIGILPISKGDISYRSSLAWNSIIGSESYLVSMIFFIMALSILVPPVLKKQIKKMTLADFCLLSVLLIGVGFSKISTLFIFDVIYFYLFVRFKFYKSFFSTIFLFAAAGISLALYYLLFDSKAPSGSIEFLSFYRNYIRVDFPVFILLAFIWTFVLAAIWLFMYFKKIDVSTVLIELQIVVAVFGFLPGAFFRIAGGSAYYFSDIQHWTALFFIPYYYNFCRAYVAKINLNVIRAVWLLFVFLAVNNSIYTFERLIKENFATKSCLLGKIYYAEYVKMRQVIDGRSVFFDKDLNTKLRSNEDFGRLKFLTSLDTIEHKEQKILNIEDQEMLLKYLPCYKAPFFVTAATGMAIFNGYSLKHCFYADYGVEYYTREEIISRDQDICKLIKDPIFKEVVNCDLNDRSYKVQACRN